MFTKIRRKFSTGKQRINQQIQAAFLVLAFTLSMAGGGHENRVRRGRRLSANNRGATSASRAVGLVVGLTVGGLVAAFLIPVAVNEIVGVDTSSWGSGASSLWDIMDLIIVLAVFLFFIGLALVHTDRI